MIESLIDGFNHLPLRERGGGTSSTVITAAPAINATELFNRYQQNLEHSIGEAARSGHNDTLHLRDGMKLLGELAPGVLERIGPIPDLPDRHPQLLKMESPNIDALKQGLKDDRFRLAVAPAPEEFTLQFETELAFIESLALRRYDAMGIEYTGGTGTAAAINVLCGEFSAEILGAASGSTCSHTEELIRCLTVAADLGERIHDSPPDRILLLGHPPASDPSSFSNENFHREHPNRMLVKLFGRGSTLGVFDSSLKKGVDKLQIEWSREKSSAKNRFANCEAAVANALVAGSLENFSVAVTQAEGALEALFRVYTNPGFAKKGGVVQTGENNFIHFHGEPTWMHVGPVDQTLPRLLLILDFPYTPTNEDTSTPLNATRETLISRLTRSLRRRA